MLREALLSVFGLCLHARVELGSDVCTRSSYLSGGEPSEWRNYWLPPSVFMCGGKRLSPGPAELGPRLSGRVTLSLSSLSPRLELLSFGGTVAGKRAEQEELTQG